MGVDFVEFRTYYPTLISNVAHFKVLFPYSTGQNPYFAKIRIALFSKNKISFDFQIPISEVVFQLIFSNR